MAKTVLVFDMPETLIPDFLQHARDFDSEHHDAIRGCAVTVELPNDVDAERLVTVEPPWPQNTVTVIRHD